MAGVPRAYEALAPAHKHAIAELMWAAREVAHRIPTTRRLMTAQIKHLAFYWTTSAFCPERQAVIPDAIKFDTRFVRHTSEAHRVLGAADGEGVIHEHAVPRSVLANYVVDQATSIEEVIKTFDRHCVAVLVTEGEDKQLNAGGFRDRMPAGWTWSSEPLARYVALGINVIDLTNDVARHRLSGTAASVVGNY